MIFQTWSNPTKPDVWHKHSGYLSLLGLFAFVGLCISGCTEFVAADTITQGIITVLLLEIGSLVFGAMFFSNLFSIFRNWKDISSYIFTIIAGIALYFILSTSYNMSLVGKSKYVKDNTPPPTEIKTDSSKYNTLLNSTLEGFKADSLDVISKVDSMKIARKQDLKNTIQSKKNRKKTIMSYADYSYEKYVTSIKGCESAIATANKELRNLNKDFNELKEMELNKVRSKKNKGFSFASSSLVSAMDSTNNINGQNTASFNNLLLNKELYGQYVVMIGIFAVLVYLFCNNLARYLSGSVPVYKNPFKNVLSPMERLKYGLRLWFRIGFDKFVDYITPQKTISVLNKGYEFATADGQLIKIDASNLSPTPPAPEEKVIIETPIIQNTNINPPNTQKPVIQPKSLPPKEILRPVYRIENNQIKVVEEKVTEVEQYLKKVRLNEQKHRINLINTWKKMKSVYDGDTNKRKLWKEDAQNRLVKISNFAFELGLLGYKIEVVGDELHVDEIGHQTYEKNKNHVSLSVPDNDYRFPIAFNYNPINKALAA